MAQRYGPALQSSFTGAHLENSGEETEDEREQKLGSEPRLCIGPGVKANCASLLHKTKVL